LSKKISNNNWSGVKGEGREGKNPAMQLGEFYDGEAIAPRMGHGV